MAQQFSGSGVDDMDVIMSQIDARIFENNSANVGPMQKDKDFVKNLMGEALDTIDEAMSQIDTETLFNQMVEVDAHGEQNIPTALMEKYEDAINEIDEEMVEQMEQEPDVDVDPSDIPQELLAEYDKAVDGILPVKSTDRYLQAYHVFRKWQASHGTESFHEKVILAYFSVSSEKYKPPTLWRFIKNAKEDSDLQA